ncbi:MAG TPA: M61 family peptidase, partial [Thermoanaerobaculia bacterium]|nr:M61 family peptidase [Thermoanaerobaculia bacterium]
MKPTLRRPLPVLLLAGLAALCLAAGSTAQTAPATSIALSLDASQVAQRILHIQSEIPVAPGPLTLLYPKWIPGEHGPTGPLANLVDLHFSANGKEIAWERDPVEMYALHLTIPPGATRLSVKADFLFPGEGGNFTAGPSATDFLAVISWNTVALY